MSELTVSQALRRIKKLKGELSELRQRASGSVSYPASREPAFKFFECVSQSNNVRDELLYLESCLAATNATTSLVFEGREMSLAEATRWLQEYKGQIAWYENLNVREHDKTTEETWDYSEDYTKKVKTTVEWRCALPKAQQVETIRQLREKFDKLNDAVETMNHRTILKKGIDRVFK